MVPLVFIFLCVRACLWFVMESESWRGWYRYFIFYWAFFLYLYAVWGEGVMSKRRKKRRVCNNIYLYSTRKGGKGRGFLSFCNL